MRGTQEGQIAPHYAHGVLRPHRHGVLDDEAAVMRLPSDPEGNRRRVEGFTAELIDARQWPADLSCIPDNATAVTNAGLVQATDCESWHLEPPDVIGLYHAYINKDARSHRLFVVCSGGCAKAADKFCNLLIDVVGERTTGMPRQG